ncbi:MAG: hypothetical protein IID17_10365 [Nitrospinae bacterium]|nr:hypothetical protein [Nitrospinota bacterium]
MTILNTFLGVKGPLTVILNKAVLVYRSGMVDDNAIKFTVIGTQTAPCHLVKQP